MIWEFHGQLNLFWMHYVLRTFAAKSDIEKLGYISVAISFLRHEMFHTVRVPV